MPPHLKLRYPGHAVQDFRVLTVPFSGALLGRLKFKGQIIAYQTGVQADWRKGRVY